MATAPKEEVPKALKATGSLVAGVMVILGGIWGVDGHYATAKEVDELKVSTAKSIESMRQNLDQQLNAMRQERTEDEISRLVAKRETQSGKLSPEDMAQYNRLIRRSAAFTQQDARKINN